MSGVISPNPKFLGTDNNNEPVVGGKLFTYISGTTTKQTTYNSSVISPGNANSNPVVMDSAGRATVFLDPTLAYKFVFSPSTDTDPPVSPYWTVDGISESVTTNLEVTGTAGETIAVGEHVYLSDGTGGLTAGRWYLTDADLAYKSSSAAALGVSLSALSAGQSGLIRTDGIYDAASGLSAGSIYYLSGTAGAITSAVPSTNARIVAQAYSSTAFKILYQSSSTAATFVSGVAGENLTLNDCVYMSDGSGGKTTGRWYQADADLPYGSVNALSTGFVAATVTTGSDCSVQKTGRISGFSALTAGAKYYISGTAGAITATAPTNAVLMAVADTTTSIVLVPVPSFSPIRLAVDTSSVGNGAGVLTTLHTYTLVGTTLATNSNVIKYHSRGFLANNANAKTLNFVFGATTLPIINAAVITNSYYDMYAYVVRTGAATQTIYATLVFSGGIAAQTTTATETLSGDVVIKCQGNGAGASDVTQTFSHISME